MLSVQSLEEKLATLTADFEKATSEKLKCQQEADATNATIRLANRLVNGLASENVRWAESVSKYVTLLRISKTYNMFFIYFPDTKKIHTLNTYLVYILNSILVN